MAGFVANTDGMVLMRTDPSGSIIRWTKTYRKPSTGINATTYFIGNIVQKGDDLFLTGQLVIYNALNTNFLTHGILLKLNGNTGQTNWTKDYYFNGNSVAPRDVILKGTGLLVDVIAPAAQVNLMRLDTSGNIIHMKGINIQGITMTPSHQRIMQHQSGDIYILNSGTQVLPLQPYITTHSLFTILDSNYNAKWTKHFGVYGILMYPAIGQKGTFAAIGDGLGSTLPTYYSLSPKIQLKKIDSVGTDAGCNYVNFPTLVSDISNVTMVDFAWTTDSVLTTLNITDTAYSINTFYSEVRYVCPTEFIDSCSFVKITGPRSICNLSAQYVYKLHKNKTCTQPVTWQVSPTVNVINQTDTSITVQFTSFGNRKISAYLPYTCSPVKDSLTIVVASGSPPLNLGIDTVLCTGSTISLNAGSGFLTYLWQDGSSNPGYLVTAPGQYWVKVTDSCNNLLTDTINILPITSYPIDVGPDRIKCNSDTVHINSPSGFLNYSWSPNYNISSTTTQNVVVYPIVDTTYYIKAERVAGCFAYDTVHISVNHSPAIYLGADTSICSGTTISFNAGTGFWQYQWNTGAVSQQITVSSAGAYSVIATTLNGCRSYDTIRLIRINTLPMINLNKDSTLCSGDTRTLDAGPGYNNYLWNTGSIQRTIVVSDTGNYSVSVVDMNGCAGSGATYINTILPLPYGFLSPDTSICTYSKVVLKSNGIFNQYLWSDNSGAPTLTVSSAGLFWLQVTDNKNCKGRDSIMVVQKNCTRGLFVPSAFTPNGDTKNDLFKPSLFGTVKRYKFEIYNRYGQPLFTTTELAKGWDGTFKGKLQGSGTYVWKCIYQIDNQMVTIEQGTLLLIR